MSVLQAFALLLIAVVVWGFNPRDRFKYRHIPGPPPAWLFGNLREVNKLGGMHVALLKWTRECGPVFKFFLGRHVLIVVSDPDLIKSIGTKHFMRFHDRSSSMYLAGSSEADTTSNFGILTAKGKYWTGLRAACEPMFHTSSLNTFAPLMNTAAVRLTERCLTAPVMEDEGETGTTPSGQEVGTTNSDPASTAFNISKTLAPFTLQVLGSTAFGVAFNTQEDTDSRLVKEANFIMSPPKNPNNILRLVLLLAPKMQSFGARVANMLSSARMRRMFTARGYLLGTSQVLLDNARRGAPPSTAQREADLQNVPPLPGMPAGTPLISMADQNIKEVYVQGKRDAFRDHGESVPSQTSILNILALATDKISGEKLSSQQIVAQSQTFILAGYETTSVTLTYTIFAIASFPEVEQRVLEEVDAFWKKGNDSVGYEHMELFPYVNAVISEAMRMWPPVTPFIGLQRAVNESTEVGGYSIPRGSCVWLNALAIHRDERHYPQPEVFRPERFIEGSAEAANRHPNAYLPFGIGPRKCIGYKFALEEAVIALVQLFRTLTFKLDPKRHPVPGQLELQSGITLAPKGGVWVTSHARLRARRVQA